MYSLRRGGAIALSALEHSPILRGVMRKLSTLDEKNKSKSEHIIILGGGIAGLSTARYLLQLSNFTRITLIDRNVDINSPDNSKYPSSYEEQICTSQMHMNIPSRRNGNVLCPSLTIPWTTRPLWKEAILPGLKSILSSTGDASPPPPITFDWPSLIMDRNMWSFGKHFFLQKLFGNHKHQSNKSILEYNMQCLDDPSDELVQSIEYGRCAIGTKLPDGSIKEMDSSGDIGLFSRGLLVKLQTQYHDRLTVVPGEDASLLQVNRGVLHGVTTVDQHGNDTLREADKIVVALGVNSASLCNTINVPCPVYPVKGHLVTVSSKIDCKYNITLDGGVGYAAPMAHIDSEGRRLYRLSGFVDFTHREDADHNRVEALMDAARVHLPDLQLIDSSACFRPISADDRPLIGPSTRYPNLFLLSGFGSRGWSVGLGSGKLLAQHHILGLACDIDPEPYLPSRFSG